MLCILVLLLLTNRVAAQQAAKPVNAVDQTFELVKQKALSLSTQEYVKPKSELPKSLADMSYQQYRSIRFSPEKAIWKDKSKFEMQLFHPGFLYKTPVTIQTVDSGASIKTLSFEPDRFNYEQEAQSLIDVTPKETGYAGFRLHYPLNRADYKDEIAVFLGASYFRLVGPGQTYGLSARGLAINTAHAKGEEFPLFTRFWIVEPSVDSNQIILFALLDSPSVVGAYKFVIGADLNTHAEVESVLYARTDIDKLGIAPLTSMFLHGENSVRKYDDFRPEVHDSDGLAMHTSGGEYIWRQLGNPKRLQVTSLQDTQPKGFGLLQRDTAFDNYLDTETDYHSRPGLWITPTNNWGKGRVELVEIPTDSETNDNIVTYWVPDEPLKQGQSRAFNYTLTTVNGTLLTPSLAQVKRSFNGWAALPGQENAPPRNLRQIIVDFSGEALQRLSASIPVEANLTVSGASHSELIVFQLPDEKTWRVTFKLNTEKDATADIRLNLSLRGKPISEVWSYVWSQDEIE